MNSDTNIISRRAFLKVCQPTKAKNKDIFNLITYFFSRQKAIAFKTMYYFSLQSDSMVVEFSFFKHEVVIVISYKAQNKT